MQDTGKILGTEKKEIKFKKRAIFANDQLKSTAGRKHKVILGCFHFKSNYCHIKL